MALLQEWQKVAYNEKANQGELQRFWQRYFLIEKGIKSTGGREKSGALWI